MTGRSARPDRHPPTRQDGTTGPTRPPGPGAPGPRPRPRAGILRLTPDRIRDAEFPRTPLGRRGLDEEDVRSFLQQIAEEVATRDAADAAARATIDHYKHALARWQAERSDEAASPPDPQTEAIDVLTKAQREAEAYVAEAREYGRRLLDDARTRAQ
ncbi:MAG TPA: DivIVA domain-containing protein, partial [Acidimicrobiales bacterium]|nr:DivIVA domain-containing protein [Acidimicrobiales bacterium]